MHIIIDIRDAHPFWSIIERYGESWWKIWKSHHPHDSISYLIFESQYAKTDEYIQVPRWASSWWRKKKIVHHKNNEIFRCINFSSFDPYSRHIPTLTHIFNNRQWLYPHDWESSYIAKKALEYKMRRIARNSHKIIVPSMSVWLECVELWWIKEHDIEIIPYIPLEVWESDDLTGIQYQIQTPYFLYDWSFWTEGNIIGMLKWFEKYRHIHGGKTHLVLHGSLGQELTHITHVLRSFELTDSVKLVGTLEWENYEWLYKHAKAWIMVGSYYSGWPRIELAYAHKIPMILSDITAIRWFGATYIHPNHISEELTSSLIHLEKRSWHKKRAHEYEVADILRAYEIHLAENQI